MKCIAFLLRGIPSSLPIVYKYKYDVVYILNEFCRDIMFLMRLPIYMCMHSVLNFVKVHFQEIFREIDKQFYNLKSTCFLKFCFR